MQKPLRIVISVVCAAVALGIVAYAVSMRPPEQSPVPKPPIAVELSSQKFGENVEFSVGKSVMFEDGLIVTLNQIDDSRCAKDVVCIWAGELSAAFTVSGGSASDLAQNREVRLGSINLGMSTTVGDYAFSLIAMTETTATLQVAKRASAVPGTKDNVIRISTPVSREIIASPYVVTGEARGNWYFEASFPVTLLDEDGSVLVAHYAQAKGDWMTTEFVPFESTIVFPKPKGAVGTLVLAKDNPSGLPEHDDEIRIQVRFSDAKAAVGNCRPSGCSGQICADQDMMSDCQYREEYACYKTATCERQKSGKCGWTDTPALSACLQSIGARAI